MYYFWVSYVNQLIFFIRQKAHNKYLEFCFKTFEKSGNFAPKTMRKPGIWFGGKGGNRKISRQTLQISQC